MGIWCCSSVGVHYLKQLCKQPPKFYPPIISNYWFRKVFSRQSLMLYSKASILIHTLLSVSNGEQHKKHLYHQPWRFGRQNMCHSYWSVKSGYMSLMTLHFQLHVFCCIAFQARSSMRSAFGTNLLMSHWRQHHYLCSCKKRKKGWLWKNCSASIVVAMISQKAHLATKQR